MSDNIERVLCVKNEVFVYKIPPRTSNRGYRAADWSLDKPDWTGRLRIVTLKGKLIIKLDDKSSGQLFAECPVEAFPSPAIEQVLDSSRYFVINILGDGGRSAFIGIGFADRGDSFDLNVTIQDHFKQVRQEKEIEEEAAQPELHPKLDLGFKEGQTIRINIGGKAGAAKSRPKPSSSNTTGSSGLPGLLPPPPGSSGVPQIRPPHVAQTANSSTASTAKPDLTLVNPPFQAPQEASNKKPTQATAVGQPSQVQSPDLLGDLNATPATVSNPTPASLLDAGPMPPLNPSAPAGAVSLVPSSAPAAGSGDSSTFKPQQPVPHQANMDLLAGLDSLAVSGQQSSSTQQSKQSQQTLDGVATANANDPWGDFMAASSGKSWVEF